MLFVSETYNMQLKDWHLTSLTNSNEVGAEMKGKAAITVHLKNNLF